MKFIAFLVTLAACTCSFAQDDVGRSEPPFVEATVSMLPKNINDHEKRCDMVQELSEKSEMNYRLLALKIMEQWETCIKNDKTFLRNTMRCKKVSFTVHKSGSIEIQGIDPPASGDKNKGS